MSTPHVEVHLSLDLGDPYRVVACRVHEAVSEITHAVVEIASAADLDVDATRAADATLEIHVGDVVRSFQLVVTGLRFVGLEGGAQRYEVDLHARPFLLRHTRNTRKFRDLPAHEIVARVLGARNVAFELRVERETPSRPYTAQYGESDLDFAARLLEFEGIHYAFEPDGTMVLADRSSAAPPVDGPSSRFDLLDAADALTRGELGILAIERAARVAPGRATVNDFDWQKPRADLRASSAAGRDEELEIYDYPTGYRDPAVGAFLARIRLEAARALAARFEGTSDVPTFAAGRTFTMGDAAGPAFAGDVFLVSVEHRAENLRAHGERGAATYRNRFVAIPREVPYRPPIRAPRPTVAGTHTAMVRGPAGAEIHTDRFGRFRAQFHWDREAKGTDEDSRWVRMLQEPSTSMALARVGWEVGLAYVDGDPDRPIGISRQINGVMPPAYPQPLHKNAMTLKTPSSPATGGYSELKLDDSAEKMMFALRAERDMSAAIGRDKGETIGRDERRFVGNDATEGVGGDQSITVGRSLVETVDGDRHLKVDHDRTKTVAGSEDVEVGGTISVSTNGDETERVGLARITLAGGITMPDVLARAKRAVSGLVPTKEAALGAIKSGVVGGAQAGAQAGAMQGFEGAGGLGNLGGSVAAGLGGALGGAASGAMSGLGQSLTGLLPNPRAIASDITGGLSEGVSLEKIADQVLTGSIGRTAEAKMRRTVGGAFIAVAAKELSASSAKAYVETIGGVKLSKVTGSIDESVDGVLTITAGGSILRSSAEEMIVSAGSTSATVGASITLHADDELRIEAPTIEVTALSGLVLKSEDSVIDLGTSAIELEGNIQIKGTSSVAFWANKHNLVEA